MRLYFRAGSNYDQLDELTAEYLRGRPGQMGLIRRSLDALLRDVDTMDEAHRRKPEVIRQRSKHNHRFVDSLSEKVLLANGMESDVYLPPELIERRHTRHVTS